MSTGPVLYFASYRLDPRAHVLWQGDAPIHLTPKAFGVLEYLARHAGRVVTKHELLDHVWSDVHVGDAVLKVAIREIRQALKDDPETPEFVMTSRRVGYSFVSPVSSTAPAHIAKPESALAVSPGAGMALIGREAAMATLNSALARATAGKRQIVFIVGEGGIGKTSVADAFLSQVELENRAWVARGQCLEHAGGAEAYLPVLEALGRLARLPGRERVVALLRRFAPTWLAQLPALVEERDALQQEILGATPDRMLREIAEALEALTADTPLVLFLDDLHWSDNATLDFVGLIARRSGPSRLLLVGAYRPVDVVLIRPALKTMKQELAVKGLCEEILLDFLTPRDADALIGRRFPGHTFPAGLADLVHQRTSGNPLFMTNLMDYLAAQGIVHKGSDAWELTTSLDAVATASPETLRQVIEAQLSRVTPDERDALEAASVCGIDFSAVTVAAGLGTIEEAVEASLDGLAARSQFVTSLELVELPAHGWSSRYQFVHSLHRETLYRSLPPARRLRLHLRIAERIEQLYESQTDQVASELAEHFEQSRDYRRAIGYLQVAARNETRRFANREAAGWLDRALELAENLPAEERVAARVAVLGDLGRVRRNMGDMRGSSGAFMEAARTAGQGGDVNASVEALLLAGSATTWFDGAACLAAADDAERLAQRISPTLAKYTRGYSAYWYLLWKGWNADWGRDCERALALARETQDSFRLFAMLPRCAYGRLVQSQYAEAAAAAAEGGDRALALEDAFGRMVCQFYRAWAELLAGSWGTTSAVLDESLNLAERNGHRSWRTIYAALRSWLLREAGAHDAALALARDAVAESRGLGVAQAELLTRTQLGLAIVDHAGAVGAPPLSEGREILESLVARMERESMLMGFAWKMPVLIGLSAAHRRCRAWPEAERTAQEACDLAASSGERTWLALARIAQAEAALEQGDQDRGHTAVDGAIAAVETGGAPLAAWRVYACAARLSAAQGRVDDALRHQAGATVVINQLADSLPADSELRRLFLGSREVRESASFSHRLGG